MRKSKRRVSEGPQEIYFARKSILLDTHVWFWLMSEDRRLMNSKRLNEIQNARVFGQIKVSAISVWEIGLLGSKGRIFFPFTCLEWVHEALNAPGISLVPISPEIAVEASYLPGHFHGDPADRIIVASARVMELTLLTRDRSIIKYGKDGYLEVREV